MPACSPELTIATCNRGDTTVGGTALAIMRRQKVKQSLAVAFAFVSALCCSLAALAQKPGGILRLYHPDSPANMSVLESETVSVIGPMMAVFNNLLVYDQHVPQNSFDTLRPDLAESWSWRDDGKELTFKLRQGISWHDGRPFTAADVKCTWELIQERSNDRLRTNPRKSWYTNVEDVAVEGPYEVTFRLGRPQPALLALLAGGHSPIYPCHVAAAEMRRHPIGTGPFKFVGYKAGESIKLMRNPNYWKPGRPYLDGIEYTIVPNRSTAILGFIAGTFDMTFPYGVTVPLLRDVQAQVPHGTCQITPTNVSTNLLLNQTKPPFDNLGLRRAVALALDRTAFAHILMKGQALIGGAMLPPPAGVWGLRSDALATSPGYDGQVERNRSEARRIMDRLGYGPEKRLDLTVSARDAPAYRDASVILIDQLKHIWIGGTLHAIETANWYPKLSRKDYTIALNLTGSAIDDPDQQFFENYACGTVRNFSGYCSPEMEKLFVVQSVDTDQARRKELVWHIDSKLQQEVARPIIYHSHAATCWHPQVKGLTVMVNSIYNGWRMEDVWLDK